MTDHHPRVMEGNWNTAEVWPVPVPVECLLNGMNAPESHLMFGGNHMLPPHFRQRFSQSPVCLSTAHLGPPQGALNVSIPTHSMVEGGQVSVDSSAGPSEQNDPDAHSISQPMALDNSDVLEETDEASDEDEEDDEDGEDEVTVPMSIVHEQQHGQPVTMSHPIDNDGLVQCQQDPLQVNTLQGDPMQQQGPMIATMSQEQCQHQKSALVNNPMTHAHTHNATNPSLGHPLPPQQLPHSHPHNLSGNPMIANPLSLPVQQPPNTFSNNSIPQPNDNNSQANSDPNLGYTVQGKMYYEGRVVLHLKQLRNSFGGMNGGFHNNGFSSCAEADLSKNNNLMGCAICRLRNPDAQNSQRQKEAHRHSVKGVLFTFEDCLIVELYPDHIPINSNPLEMKAPPAPPEPQKTSHPMPITSYINSQPPEGPNNGKRMMSHPMEDHMDPLSAVIVASKHHQHPNHQQHPHEMHQQPNTEESAWWDDFESEDELKRSDGTEHGSDRGIVTAMKLNSQHQHQHQLQAAALQQPHNHPQEPSEQPVDHSNSGILSHDLLERHSCMATDVVSLNPNQAPQQIQSVQSIVPLEMDLSAPDSVGISEDSSSNSVDLSSRQQQQQCIGLEDGECEDEPQMVVVEVVVSDKDNNCVPGPEMTNNVGEYEMENPNTNTNTSTASSFSTTPKYSCPVCNRSFHLKKMLKSHLDEVHHSGNPYRCLQCEAQFADEKRLTKHSCTLSVETLKSRERKLSFISVFDNNSGPEKKSAVLVPGGSKHSDTQEDTESEEDFFEDSVTASDIEEDNAGNRTLLLRENSSEEEEEEDEEEFAELQIVTSTKGNTSVKQKVNFAIGSSSNSDINRKCENSSASYVRLQPQLFQDEDEEDEEEDEYEDENENENSQDENEYDCEVEIQCVEEDEENSQDAKKLLTGVSISNRVSEKNSKRRRFDRVNAKSESFKDKSINIKGKKKTKKKGGKPFTCGICGKGFSIQRRLENHKASHATERFSQCEKCGKRFARKDKLMRHMYVHSEEKMFVCDICQKRFSRRDKLSDHLKSHGTDEIHNCPMCQKQFLRPDILKQHVKLHGMGNKHQCPECLRFVTGKDRLEKHMARHEEAKALGQTLLCPLCTKYFIQRQSLKAHIKKFHPEALKNLNLDQNLNQSATCSAPTKPSKSSKSSSSSVSSATGTNNTPVTLLLDEMMTSKTTTNKPPPFACQHCPRIFVRKLALKKHLRKHPPDSLKPDTKAPSGSQQGSEEEIEGDEDDASKNSLRRSSRRKLDVGVATSTCSTHDIQSIISVVSSANTISNHRKLVEGNCSSSNCSTSSSSSSSSSTTPMSLIQISAPSPICQSNSIQTADNNPTPSSLHHQLPHGLASSSNISCNGGPDTISVSPVTHIQSSCALVNVSQANAQAILNNAASEMSHFSHQHAAAVAAAHQHHVHHSHHHLASPHHHYASATHNFLTAAAIGNVSSSSASVVTNNQQTVTATSSTQQATNAVSSQLSSSPSAHAQLHPHLSQLTVPLHQHVNVGMTPSQSMCGSSYLLTAYPHYSYQ